MTTLQNKTALVTGASRGIGRATALALARAGAEVVVHYGRSAQEAESLVAEIKTKGTSCPFLVRTQASLLSLPLELVRCRARPVWRTLPFLLTARPKERLRRWSRTGRPFSGR